MISRRMILAVAVIAVAIPVVYYLASPLFINVVVQENIGNLSGSDGRVIATGSFLNADDFHKASGEAKLIRRADGGYIIRLEGFRVTNGPDLYVYLANDKAASAGYVDLGRLKGNVGDQNYEVPRGMNPEGYVYVLIWCKAFSVLFGSAQLAKT